MICDRCGDTGTVRSFGHEDYGVSFESEHCESCRYGAALIALDQATYDQLSPEAIDARVDEVEAAQAEIDAREEAEAVAPGKTRRTEET